jgi:S1-C subfamily serine protease
MTIRWKQVGHWITIGTIAIGFGTFIAMPFVCLYTNLELVSTMEKRIKLIDYKYNQNVKDLTKLIKEGFKDIVRRDDIQDSKIETVIVEIENIERKVQATQGIDLEDVNSIKEANVLIVNNTSGCSGSGTYVKIKDEYFILSCAHLIEKQTDSLVGILDDGTLIRLEIMKFDKSKDLSLLKIKTSVRDLKYLEISTEFPQSGSSIIVIGNPDSMTDVITEGVIANVNPTNYIITNLIYYGNSGGAVLYKGKLIGVVTKFSIFFSPPVFVNYGYAVSLTEIHDFLGDIF